MLQKVGLICLMLLPLLTPMHAYSALEDARTIAEYKRQAPVLNHAKIARQLVHQSDWTPMGTISTTSQVPGYPMVNTISIDDSNLDGTSNGKIHFYLTDLDFTGKDWQKDNKVTLLFSDEMNLNCRNRSVDPMEPICARAMISGQVIKMDTSLPEYADAKSAFIKRHPAAIKWPIDHGFYMCELKIENIFVLDFYGGPQSVTPDTYYNTAPNAV